MENLDQKETLVHLDYLDTKVQLENKETQEYRDQKAKGGTEDLLDPREILENLVQ